MTMQQVTFTSKPGLKSLGMPNDPAHYELTKAATDTSGHEWAPGTQLRPLHHGSQGFVYVITASEES